MKRKNFASMAQAVGILLFALCFCCAAPPVHSQTYWDGSAVKNWTGTGTEDDPILISTAEQLAGLADSVNSGDPFAGKYIRLTNDIWLTDTTVAKELRPEWDAIGHRVMHGIGEVQDTAAFGGHFDGAGYNIHFLYTGSIDGFSGWDDPDDPTFEGTIDGATWYKALFGYISEEATIRNLHLKETAITGSADVAGLVLYNRGTIEDCSMEGVVFGGGEVGSHGGGLVSENYGTIARCTVHGKSRAARNVGMIAGINYDGGIIHDCYVTGNLQADQYNAGGLVGWNSGLIEDCGADVIVRHGSYMYGSSDVGGFVAVNEGTIRHCYAHGDVYTVAFHSGGGFVADNRGRIESCYSTGNTYGTSYGMTGNFVCVNGFYDFYNGWSEFTPGIIINCFSTGGNFKENDDGEITVSQYGFCMMQETGSNSLMVNCYYVTDYGIDATNDVWIGCYDVGGSELRDSSMLQTQAFVDTLNMVAAWLGTSTWQYNPGGYPTPTKQVATNITDYCEGGDGSETNPFRIGTKEHLVNFATMVNKGYDFREQHILQTADIALNRPMSEWGEEMPTAWRPIGDSTHNYQHHFRGNYNGDFHEVRNLYLNNFHEYQGFFGCLHHGAVVRNLGVTDVWMRAKGDLGILAGCSSRYAEDVIISQCWTSGQAESEWNASGILGEIALEGKTDILNCRSSAILTGSNYASAVVGDEDYIDTYSTDTIGNFLFTGTLNAPNVRWKTHFVPMFGYEQHFNGYFDHEVFPLFDSVHIKEQKDYCAATTAYLQGKEIVNIYNAWVDEYNSNHTFQLNYWQQNEGGYPNVSPTFLPPHTVHLVSNGGDDYADIHALDSSFIPMPKTPARESMAFGGWYSDADCTQLFVFDTAMVVSDTTLYAKWITLPAYDLTPFTNPFATSYTIRTVEQLYGFAVAVNGMENVINPMTFEGKTVTLAADLVLNDPADWQQWGENASAVTFTPIGNYDTQFLGTFDGQGHTITGLYATGTGGLGLFGYIGRSGTVKNLHIEKSVLLAPENGGSDKMGLLASACNGTVTHCTTHGKVLGAKYLSDELGSGHVGGLIGDVGGWYGERIGKITYCGADVEATGTYYVGGLIGLYDSNDTIAYCYAKGTIEGLVAGGLVGSLDAKIQDCYSLANVNCTNNGAGLAIGEPPVINSYCANTVKILDVVWDGAVSSYTSSDVLQNVYYLSHDVPIDYGWYGTPLTDFQMHLKQCFGGFDFDEVWGRKDTINGGYPYLRWQYDEYIPDDPDADYVPVEGVTFDMESKQMLIGTTFRLTANVLPADASNQNVLWKSNRETVAIVDETGLVTALSAGTAVITAQTQEGLKTANCTITVITPSISINTSSAMLILGESIQLTATFTPDSLTQPVVWTSSDPSVASVEDGLVTGLTVGRTNISAATLDGSIVSKVCPVTVTWTPVTGISLSGVSTIHIGETATLTASVIPTYASNQRVLWSTSDETVLSVDETGAITGLAAGMATVTAETEDGGYTASKEITVIPVAVTGVSLSRVPTLQVGETYQMEAIVYPDNATDKRVLWTSSDSTILHVDSTGLLTARAEGLSNITVTTVDGEYLAWQLVRISGFVYTLTDFTLDYTSITLSEGETFVLTPQILPEEVAELDNTYIFIMWESTDLAVANVNEEGVVIAFSAGTTTIVATATFMDVSLTATCQVTVTAGQPGPVVLTDFSITPTEAALTIGETLTLVPVITPAEATDYTTVTWQSSDPEVVSVNNGVITALMTGEATVTASATYAETTLEATCHITCYPATGLQAAEEAEATARKVLIDNVLYVILPDGSIYDATGQRVK